MSNRQKAVLAWTLFGLGALSGGFSFLRRPAEGSAAGPYAAIADFWYVLGLPLLCIGIGALIVARQPRNVIGWLVMLPGLMMAVYGPSVAYLFPALAAAPPSATLPLLILFWFSNWSWLLLIYPMLLIAQLFPTGQPLSPRWGWLARATLLWAGLFAVFAALAEGITTIDPPYITLPNPIGVFDQATLERLVEPWIAGMLALMALSLLSLVMRFRRAGPVERGQIKWLLYACALFAVNYIAGSVLGIAGTDTQAGHVFELFFVFSLLTFPAAIGIAILRYRVWDIDVVIRRTLVYSVLTLALGVLYLATVVTLQTLFVRLTGQENMLAIVASTLSIAALFGPLRERVQRFIDRRFFRRKYDAARVVNAFARRAQSEAELDVLADDVLGVVQGALEPERARLWLIRG